MWSDLFTGSAIGQYHHSTVYIQQNPDPHDVAVQYVWTPHQYRQLSVSSALKSESLINKHKYTSYSGT